MANTNRFFKHSNEEGVLGRGFCYYEFAPFDHEWAALRQIEADGETFLTSNLPTQMLGLCDQPIASLDSGLPFVEITQKEFEDTWNRALCATTQSWHQFKITHPTGTLLPANALGFYPQGVLAEIDAPFFGLLEYVVYRKQFAHLGHRVQTRIVGFDEKYRWALLEMEAT
jgi:hypothetical protein